MISLFCNGGLGVCELGTVNQTLLGKWLWQIGVEDTHLWRQVISMKYVEEWDNW